MKKIICFICSLSSGGAEHQISELSNILVKEGYQVQLVTFGDFPDHYRLDPNVVRLRLAENKSKISKFISIFTFFLTCKADCIFSYGQRESVFCIIPSIFRLRRNKIVACERSCTINRKADIYENLLMKFLYKKVFAIVCNSYTQKEHILKLKPEYKNKLYTIINHINLNAFAPAPYPYNDIIRICVFARYDKLKNYERLVEVVTAIKAKGYSLCLEWFGSCHMSNGSFYPDYLNLMDLITNNDICDCFKFHDQISNVSSQIAKSDAVCIASLWEGFSNTIAEGISCGRPMIVSDVSDNSVMVHDGENGFLFNPFEINEIIKTFEKFLRLSRAERAQMGDKSRKIAESLFSSDVFINSHKRLIEG